MKPPLKPVDSVPAEDYDQRGPASADVWQLSLPISPVTGAVYLEPDLSMMPPTTPYVVAIMPDRVQLIDESIHGVQVQLKGAGAIQLHEKYRGRANEIAYWFRVAKDLQAEKETGNPKNS